MAKQRVQIASSGMGRRGFLCTGLTVVAGALMLPRPVWGLVTPQARIRRRVLWAMGGWHHLAVSGDNVAIADDALSSAVSELRLIDRTFSVFDPRSPLSRLNRSSEITVPVDSELIAEGIGEALALAQQTEGAFDPTVEHLMRRWGFRDGVPKSGNGVRDGNSVCSYREIEFDDVNQRLRRNSPQIAIDPGGWAKGWAAERAANAALRLGVDSATVNCGGDIYYAGQIANSEQQTLIRNPAGGRFDTLLKVRHRFPAVATSANTESFRRNPDGVRYGHLLNPQTESPAASDCVSVTVLGPDGLSVDAVASALFVMGSARALKWLADHPTYAAILIKDGWSRDAKRIVVHGAIGVTRC